MHPVPLIIKVFVIRDTGSQAPGRVLANIWKQGVQIEVS